MKNTRRVLVLWHTGLFNENDINKIRILYNLLLKTPTEKSNNRNFNDFFEGVQPGNLTVLEKPEIFIKSDLKGSQKENFLFELNDGTAINPNLKNYLDDFMAILLPVELNWYDHDYADFFGITLVQKMRLAGITLPVFFFSWLPENYFRTEPNGSIISSMGHYFLQLPDAKMVDYPVRELEQQSLFDVQSSFCGIRQEVSRLLHTKTLALAPGLNIGKRKSIIKDISNKIRRLNPMPLGLIEELNRAEKELDGIQDEKGIGKFLNSRYTDEFLIGFFDEEPGSQGFYALHEGWEVLILDDQPDQTEKLVKLLKESNIKVHQAKTYEDAVSHIEQDVFNFITIAIVDYRLEDEYGNCKGSQGYDFISYLRSKHRLTDFIVYSGYAKEIVLYNLPGLKKDQYFRKTELIEPDRLIEKIIETGDELYESIIRQPSSSAWKSKYADLYSEFRIQEKFKLYEDKVSNEATRYVENIKHFFSNKGNSSPDWYRALMKEHLVVPPFDGIRGELKGNFDDKLKIFHKILVARRVLLVMKYYLKETDSKILADLVFKGIYKRYFKAKEDLPDLDNILENIKIRNNKDFSGYNTIEDIFSKWSRNLDKILTNCSCFIERNSVNRDLFMNIRLKVLDRIEIYENKKTSYSKVQTYSIVAVLYNVEPDDKALFDTLCVGEYDFPERILVEESHWMKINNYGYKDQGSISSIRKDIILEKSEKTLLSFYLNNIITLAAEPEKYDLIKQHLRLWRIRKKEIIKDDKTFQTILKALGFKIFRSFLDLMIRVEENISVLYTMDSINEVITEYQRIQTNLSQKKCKEIAQELDELYTKKGEKVNYLTPLSSLFTEEVDDSVIDELEKYFLIDWCLKTRTPETFNGLIEGFRQYDAFRDNKQLEEILKRVNQYG